MSPPRPPGPRLAAGTVLALLLAITAVLGLGAGAAEASIATTTAAPPPIVVIIAVPDLLWSDVSPTGTPTLWRLMTNGSAGVLSVKSRWQLAGCADGLLTLGAGNRAAAESSTAPRVGCSGYAPTNPAIDKANRAAGVGALATALRTAGQSTRVRTQVFAGLYAAPARTRAADATTVDTQIGQALATDPPGAVVLVVGISDGASSTEAHLHVVIADGPGFPAGYLSSPSTKRSPYSELIDVAPTVLHLIGVTAPDSMIGRPMTADQNRTSPAARAATLRDLDVKAVLGARRRPPFMYAVSVLALVVALAGLALLTDRFGSRRRRRIVEAAAYPIAALPAISWLVQLVSWWRWGAFGLPVILLVGAVIAGALAYAGARRRPVAGLWVVCGISLVVLLGDLLTGSRLQTAALLGDSPITAGRFYGAGNTAFGVLATAALLAVLTACAVPTTQPRRRAVRGAAIALILVAAVAVVDAAPTIGADVGGGLSLFPSLLLGALLLARVRLSVARVATVLVLGAIPVVAFALWDYHRGPGRRTHIGEFVAQVRDGSAAGVIGRKISANLGQLGSSPFLLLVVGTIVVVILALRWHRSYLTRLFADTPGLAAALVAFTLCALLGGALNDSGVTVTGIMLSVALPLVTALVMRGPDPRPDPEP